MLRAQVFKAMGIDGRALRRGTTYGKACRKKKSIVYILPALA
jgi:hypothetical protein